MLSYILFLSFDFVSRFLKYGNRKQIIKELKVCKLYDSAWTFLDFYCLFVCFLLYGTHQSCEKDAKNMTKSALFSRF